MKAFSPGLSDSIASVITDAPACPRCDSSSHVAGGLCVGCLLQSGLDLDDDCEPEALVSALAEINLPDQNWRLGNYEILEEIGRGGMGVIYRARQRHSRRIVAVKRVLSYHSDSRETLARFRREAQAAASLDHPNILPIYEVSESEDGLPFFSMKFAPGGNLQEVGPALHNDPRQCVALVAKVARAVQYAHAKGILHRDLKPGNILLDARGEPLVSDFGLAKWLDATSELTRTLTIFGTPGYIAPEQANGRAADLKPTADVYSLGAILFDLLAGRPPFLGAHALSVIRQAAEFPAPKLRTLSKLADRDLETICSRCLDRDPKLRYPSAHNLAEDLERWLEGRPIIARRVSSPVRVWRWSKRNPVLAATITACVVLAGLAVVWQVRNRNLERVAAEHAAAAHSITVMPFLNLDDARDDFGLPHAIAATLDRALKRVGPSRVVLARQPPADKKVELRQVATESGATLLLSGTYRTLQNGKTRISLRLVDSDGNLVLRKVIESSGSLNAVDQAVTASVNTIHSFFAPSRRLRLFEEQLDPAMRNDKARDFVLTGRELMQRQSVADLDHAIGCFERAIEIEPASALARAYLAITAGTRLHYAFEAMLLEKATVHAQRALELNADLPDAHRALAGLAYHRGDLRRALEEAYQSVELGGPEVPMLALIGNSLKTLGEPHRAIIWYEKMASWGRRPAENAWMIGDCWADLADDERAEANYRHVSELNPELPQGWLGICRLRLLQGDFAAAQTIFSTHFKQSGNHPYTKQMAAQVAFFSRNFDEAERLYSELATNGAADGGTFYGAVTYESALGLLQLVRRNMDGNNLLHQALQTELKRPEQSTAHPENLYRLAAIESCLGDSASALRYLQKAFENGWLDYRSTDLDPRFHNIRTSEEYSNILKGMQDRVAALRLSAQTQQYNRK
jgi:tetratricopeptide (TPR) repeat protein/tRNA A-37 threonylcarbamoyl transferase component Bud32/TolB-like protein